MTDNRNPRDLPVVAHGEGLMVPAPDGVAEAIAAVMVAHQDEFDAALEPFGVTLATLLLPTWMRPVALRDIEVLDPVSGRLPVDSYVDLDHGNHTPIQSDEVAQPIGRAEGQAIIDGFASGAAEGTVITPEQRAAFESFQAEMPSPFEAVTGSPSEVLAQAINDAARAGGGPVSLPLLSDGSARCAGGECAGCRADAAIEHATAPAWKRYADGELTYEEALAIAGPLAGPEPDIEVASPPAVDGVYVTDQLRDPEPFGERIDPDGGPTSLERTARRARNVVTDQEGRDRG